MNTPTSATSAHYAKCIENSKRMRWDIDEDVIRGRRFSADEKFLPDALSMVYALDFLSAAEKRLLSRIQGRTYANMFGLVERFIGAKMLDVSKDHALGDQLATEALVRLIDEELKHQALFRRIEALISEEMPRGYQFLPDANEVANAVLGASTWAVLGLTCCIEIVTLVHYRSSIAIDDELSPLWKDVFLFHWREESQHAVLDELEWQREDAKLTDAGRDAAVTDLIGLVGAVDGLVQIQSAADTAYFIAAADRSFSSAEKEDIGAVFLRAYRYQYIVSGVSEQRFKTVLASLINARQGQQIQAALAPLFA